MKRYFWPIFLALSLGAQTPKPPAPTQPAPATFTDAEKLKFFKSRSEAQAADLTAQQAAEYAKTKDLAYKSIIDELNKKCGAAANLQLDKEGDPVCVATAPK